MNVPVKLSLYAAVLAAVFGATFFTAQLVVDADLADDWRPQIHQTSDEPNTTELPAAPEEHSEGPESEEGER